jgi:type I restriction enzyme S subunit
MSPSLWDSVMLGDVATFASGKTPPRSRQADYFDSGTVPWVKTMDLTNAGILETGEHVTQRAISETRLEVLPVGTVLVAMYGGFNQIGRTGVLRVSAVTNQALTSVLPNPTRLNSDYLLHLLNHNVDYWRTVASSSRKDPNITKADVKSFPIKLPPLGEQATVATALNEADELCATLERLIAKKQAIKQGMLQQLLTGGTRFPGFNEPWTEIRLGEIGQSLIGLTYSPSSVKRSGTLVLRSSNIQDGRIDFNDNVFVDSPIPERIRIRANDILICVRNGSRRLIGKSVLLDERVAGQTFGAFMAVYRSNANLFLQYFFQSDEFKRQIDEHLGATINQITNGSLNRFVVALPSPAEQNEIASRLSDVDAEISCLRRRLDKAQVVKQGMMQELLTGRTRLPVTESAP